MDTLLLTKVNRVRAAIALVMLIILCASVSGCINPYNIERNPLYEDNAHWISEQPYMEIINDPSREGCTTYCIVETPDGIAEYDFDYVPGGSTYFHVFCPPEMEDLYLLSGQWHVSIFDSDTFTLEIDTETDQIWGGAYEEIVFTRVD